MYMLRCIVGRLLSQPEALIDVAPSNLGASVVMGPISFSLLKDLGLVEVNETPTTAPVHTSRRPYLSAVRCFASQVLVSHINGNYHMVSHLFGQ